MKPVIREEKLVGRLSVRVPPNDERLIRKAVALSGANSISEYLVRSAIV